jgi:chromate transporter
MSLRNPGDPEEHAGIPFGDALKFWVKLGWISFGGPAGQIAILHREVVENRRWISERQFLHALNFCMLLPGPEAQQLATYIGWLLHRTRGGIAAGTLFILPSVLILLVLSYGYAVYGEMSVVVGLLSGFKAVVVAIVAEAVLRIGRRALAGRAQFLVAAGAFIGIYVWHVPFPLIVLAASLIGLVGTRVWPSAWTSHTQGGRHGGTEASTAVVAVSRDLSNEEPAPSRRAPPISRAMRALCFCLALWAVPCLILWAWLGWGSVPLQQYRFFTGAALVTFGGAYAVLAYVAQAAVHAYGWITPAQALDGLALAETTPGPLIMVLQFVGFMTGWNHPGDLEPAVAATLGALVTTWTTFLPCFLFIFVGAPYIELLEGNRALHGALSGVTASVIGVVLNLALVFGATVILPHGTAGGIDWFALVVSAAAFFALYRFRIGAHWIVLGGGLAGLARVSLLR